MAKYETISDVLAWAGHDLPDQYLALLRTHGGEFCSDVVRLYDVDELVERNDTLETKKYCPGYLTIGDDSGGRAIVIAFGKSSGPVLVVGHGDMSPEGFGCVAPDINTWIASGFTLDR